MINFLKTLIAEKLYLLLKYMYDSSICEGNLCVLEMFLRFFRHGESLKRHFVFLIDHLYTHKCKREREREILIYLYLQIRSYQ